MRLTSWRRFAEFVAPAFDLDIHDVPIKMADQQAYMMWHVNSDHDPGHRWLREAMMKALEPVPSIAQRAAGE